MWFDYREGLDDATRSSLTGTSYFGSVCSNHRYILHEDDGGFSNIYGLAHQISHSLGIDHDEDLCKNFLMSPLMTYPNVLSTCSIQKLKSKLLNPSKNPTQMANCMLNRNTQVPLEAKNASLAGQIWDADQQCKLRYGPKASFCHSYSSLLCTSLYCRESLSSKTCIASAPAAEGTTCGYRRVILY